MMFIPNHVQEFFMLQILQHLSGFAALCECVICKNTYTVKDKYTAKKVHAGDQCDSCKYLPQLPPTQTTLLQIYEYNPISGDLVYRRDFYRRLKGADPTSKTSNGYLVLTLDKTYLAHRIIWLMQTGDFPEFVDHINHNRSDNSWENLRNSTRQENAINKSVNSNNTSGYLGVSFMPSKNKYRASITKDRKQIHLGLFDTAEEAYQARLAANAHYNFHPNHGN